MATRMQQRRGTAAQWLSTNNGNGPVLNIGEIGYESDTNKFKIGDGVSHWIDLNYFADSVELGGNIDDYIPLTQKGAANGVATLNSSGVIPSEQIPSLVGLDSEITSAVSTAISNLIDAAPDALNTLNELAAALGDDPNFATSIASALNDAQVKVAGVSNTEIGYLSNVTSDIQGQIDDKANSDDMTTALGLKADAATLAEDAIDAVAGAINSGTGLTHTYDDTTNTITIDIDSTVATKTYADDAVSTHSSDSTNVHGIDDTSALATKTFAANLLVNATKTNIQITGDKDGITIVAENGVADSTTDNLSEGTTNKYFTDERAQDAVGNSVGTGLSYNDPTGAISVDQTVMQARVTDVSDIEIGYLNGVTSAIQTQIDAKAPLESPTFTGTVTLPANTISQSMMGDDSVGTNEIGGLAVTEAKIASAAVTEGKIASSAVTEGKIADGAVTSAKIANDTIVNADINSAAAIAQSKIANLTTDLAAKAALAGATFTGDVTIETDLTVDGNLTISGTTTTVNTANLNVTDAMIYMGDGNSANIVDLGIVSAFNDGTYQHTGLVRDSSAGSWKLFKGVTDEPTTTVNFTQGSLDDLAVAGLTASSITVGDVSNTELQYLNGVTSSIQTQLNAKQAVVSGVSDTEIGYLDGVTSAIQTQINAKAPTADPTFTGTVSGVTKAHVGLGNVDNTSDANKPVSTATQTALDAKLASITTINAQTSSYTLVLADKDKMVELNVGSANTLTVPLNSSVAYAVGTKISVVQTGSGQTTITPASGVTINGTPGLKTRAQWSAVTLVKRATDTWVAFGDLTA